MKIGILTHHYPENKNYGAILQLFAHYNFLLKLNHDPYVINFQFTNDYRKGIKGLIINPIIFLFGNLPFILFRKKYIKNITPKVNDKNIGDLNAFIDTFIVGSDQVWRIAYVPNIKTFFLDFVKKDKKKISYAASFGIDTWCEADNQTTTEVKELIKDFNAISVREKSGIEICNLLGVKSVQVLDPVFLFSKAEYVNFFNLKVTSSKNYFSYLLLDSNYENEVFIKNIGIESRNLSGITLPIIEKFTKIKYPVKKWLEFIYNSEFIITDSFHCIAFAILFNKKFLYVKNSTRGNTRIENLLEIFEIPINGVNIINNENFINFTNIEINYEIVNEKINLWRTKSFDFLNTNLNE